MGIEPTSKAWEALVLPLNYTRTIAGLHCADHQPIVNANPTEPYPANGITNPSAETRVNITLPDFSVSPSVKPRLDTHSKRPPTSPLSPNPAQSAKSTPSNSHRSEAVKEGLI